MTLSKLISYMNNSNKKEQITAQQGQILPMDADESKDRKEFELKTFELESAVSANLKFSRKDKLIVSGGCMIAFVSALLIPSVTSYLLEKTDEFIYKQSVQTAINMVVSNEEIYKKLEDVEKNLASKIDVVLVSLNAEIARQQGRKDISDLSPHSLYGVQYLLKQHGYNVQVDGVLGEETRRAFNDFKRKYYLGYPNKIGATTVEKLKNYEKQQSQTTKQSNPFSQPAIAASTKRFIKPATGRISSGFGMRKHPILKTYRKHNGIDIANYAGTPIKASANGTVEIASKGHNGGYGNMILIDHGNGFKTRYSHLQSISVKQGQKVSQGQLIGTIGSTGLSTGPHLDFQIIKNGVPVNPLSYL